MSYNVTGIKGMGDLMARMNEHSGGIAGVLALLIFSIIIFLYGAKTGQKSALISSAFFLGIAGLIARALEFINTAAFFMFLVVLTGVIVYTFFTD